MAVRRADDKAISRRHGGERPALSFLVRCWLEPGEGQGELSPLRGYARDLKTGEERYFRDPRKLAEHILRRLASERRERAAPSEMEELEAGIR